MKKIHFLLLAFSLFTAANAQIVNIPDARFKAMLLEANTTNFTAQNFLGTYFKIDANGDGQIQVSEALKVIWLDLANSRTTKISDLTGIENFRNLQILQCNNNQLTSLNLTGLSNLNFFDCYNNQLTSLNLTGLSNLEILDCNDNQLTSLNLTGLTNLKGISCASNKILTLNVDSLINLEALNCSYNQITSLNISKLKKIYSLICTNNQITTLDVTSSTASINFRLDNNLLKSLFIKNGFENNQNFSCEGNPTLEYICVDESEFSFMQDLITSYRYKNCAINSYCSFVPGGTLYTIQGNQKLDADFNGCDVNDILMPYLKFTISDGKTTGSLISDISGNYLINVPVGTYTITPLLENPSYYTVSPASINVIFPTQTSPFTQNFCISANGVGARPDLEVTILSLVPARPGFDAKYKLVYKNKGNIIQSGSVNLTFNDAVLDLVVANPVATSQTINNLSWNFTTLKPFETREITFTMNVNSPMETPAVINGDILNFGTTITSSAIDETPTDNTFTFNQTVVGSYDPNDKTCLEGSVITPNLIGQYVHYTIRFENTGTFAAENVVIKDMIDLTKFDISTLVPTSSSHSYVTNISAGNKVEFIFENINLPFDDANNDGYIAFKIKTKPTLVVNDSFSNEANIYFDYNFPILTNKATSTFKTLGTPDYDFDRYFSVYPNPVKDILNISTKETINVKSMSVYNTLGQLVLALPNAAKVSKIDVSSLKSGNYFIQIKTDKGSSSAQFVKE